MKILLDECVVQEFRHHIKGHDVYTVAYKGWSGHQNGALLAAAADGFDALITTDRGFQHQHNPTTLPLAVVILLARSNDLQDLLILLPELLTSLITLAPEYWERGPESETARFGWTSPVPRRYKRSCDPSVFLCGARRRGSGLG